MSNKHSMEQPPVLELNRKEWPIVHRIGNIVWITELGQQWFLIINAKGVHVFIYNIRWKHWQHMMTSSNGNIVRVIGSMCGEFTGRRWRGALVFSLICSWRNGWVNNREAGDLRRHRAYYGVIVMMVLHLLIWPLEKSRFVPMCTIHTIIYATGRKQYYHTFLFALWYIVLNRINIIHMHGCLKVPHSYKLVMNMLLITFLRFCWCSTISFFTTYSDTFAVNSKTQMVCQFKIITVSYS